MHLCWLWCLGAAAGPGRASRRRAERSSRRGRRAGGPPPPGTNTQTSKRTQAPRTASGQLTARTASRRAEQAVRRTGFETTRRAKLAARTPSGRAAAPRRQHADKKENTSSADGKRAAHGADAERAARSAADGKRAARGTGFETTRRAKLAARTASRQLAARTASRQLTARTASRQLTARTASRQLAARTPSGRAAAPGHQHAEHAHTTRPGPAAPNSAEDPGLVKQSDQAVHHEGGECFERSLDLALGQRGERCDSVVGPGARKFARLIEHVVGAQAFHDRGEGLVGG